MSEGESNTAATEAKSTRFVRLQRVAVISSRYFLALVFFVSAFGKVLEPSEFYSFASALPFSTYVPAGVFLYLLIAVELAIGILLLKEKTAFIGGIGSFCLLFSFLMVLIYSSQSGVTQNCGCFGGLYSEESLDVSIRNDLIFLIVSVIPVAGESSSETVGEGI